MLVTLGLLIILAQAGAMYLGQNWGHVLGVERIEQSRCVTIPRNFSLCHGIQYDLMRLPNLLDHETLDEAIQQSDAWNSLLRLHCHADTKLFLCSVFAPVCVPDMDKPIYPCQSLCRAVQQGCESRMVQYGFEWPEILNCSRYPENEMCMKKPDEQDSTLGSLPHSRMFSSARNQRVELTSTAETAFQVAHTRSQFRSSTRSTTALPPTLKTNTLVPSNPTTALPRLTLPKATKTSAINSDSKRECSSCAQIPTYENLLDNFCGSNTVFKAKVRQHNATHLTIQRVQRVFKPAQRRPFQQIGRFIQITDSSRDDLDCQCSTTLGDKNRDTIAGNYLVMSSKPGNELSISARLVLPWQQQDKVFKSAIRKFRKVNCGTLGREIRESVLEKNRRQQQLQF